MNKNCLILLPIFFYSTSMAQVSWLSKPVPSTSYESPIDQNILFQSMAYRQKQLDRNFKIVQSTISKALDESAQLSTINEKDNQVISFWMIKDIDILNEQHIDCSQTQVAQRILDRFNEYRRIIRRCYEEKLPKEIRLETDFF